MNILLERIKEIPALKYLLIDDLSIKYKCDEDIYSTGFTHLHKCVMKTNSYPFLNEYIEEYLILHLNEINVQNKKGLTPLILACVNSKTNSSEETVEILLKHNANVDIQDKYGLTALMHASSCTKTNSTEKTVELLLKHNANVNLQNKIGRTALILTASFYGTGKTIITLLDNGADINKKDVWGNTALILSSLRSEDAFNLLLDRKANVNIQDRGGDTALTNVIKHLNQLPINMFRETIRKLIKFGADIDIQNKQGRNAIIIATKNNKLVDIIDVLLPNRKIFIKKVPHNIVNSKNGHKIKLYDFKITFYIYPECFEEIVMCM